MFCWAGCRARPARRWRPRRADGRGRCSSTPIRGVVEVALAVDRLDPRPATRATTRGRCSAPRPGASSPRQRQERLRVGPQAALGARSCPRRQRRLLAAGEAPARRSREADAEDERAQHVDLRRHADARGAVDPQREGRSSAPAVNSVITKSSIDSAKASSAAARMPGKISGRVTLRKVVNSSAPRSIAASSRERSKPAIRARTVTTTKVMLNMTWAMMIVVRSRWTPTDTNSASSDAPSTISGVAIGRKISRSSGRGRGTGSASSARPMSVPSTVATTRRDDRDDEAVRSSDAVQLGRLEDGRVVLEREALPGDVEAALTGR